jgi:hypothetical protein
VAAEWQRKLVNFTDYRRPDMDRNAVDMQVLSYRDTTDLRSSQSQNPGILYSDVDRYLHRAGM